MKVEEMLKDVKSKIDAYKLARKTWNMNPSIANGSLMWSVRNIAQEAVLETAPQLGYEFQKMDDGEHPADEMICSLLERNDIDVKVWKELSITDPMEEASR